MTHGVRLSATAVEAYRLNEILEFGWQVSKFRMA
jgi:hypothetical protein